MAGFLISVEQLEKNTSVALFGAGGVGSYYYKELKNKRPDIKILCFIDDHKSGLHESLEILNFYEYLKGVQANMILVTTSYWKEISDKIVSENVKNFLIADPTHQGMPEYKEIIVRGVHIRSYIGSNALRLVTQNFEQTEPGTLDWIDDFEEGAIFYDIGASNGLFSLYAAISKKSKCIAFEPDAQNFASLEMNHFLNAGAINNSIVSLNIALSDKSGLEQISSVNYGAGHHGKIIKSAENRTSQEIHVDHNQYVITESLDQMISRYHLPVPRYLKIDVDGAESLVLKGGRDTLGNSSLKSVLLEVNKPLTDGIHLVEMVKQYGFDLSDIQDINEYVGTPVANVKNCLFNRSH